MSTLKLFIKGFLKGFFLGCISVILFFAGLAALDVLVGLHYTHTSVALMGHLTDAFVDYTK